MDTGSTLKVVIADDEARVCKLIQILADWESMGMEVVGVASNGVEALEQVQCHHPDILITDIRMPGYNGLELIERAKAVQPHLEMVIISGYAHFEYAQVALKFGVGDYLLKPIKKDELMATLEKLGNNCRQRKASTMEIEVLKQAVAEDTAHLQQKFLCDLMEGRADKLSMTAIARQYRIHMEEGAYLVFCLKLDYQREGFTASGLESIQNKVVKLFTSALTPLCHQALLLCQAPWGCGVLNYAPKKRDAVRRTLRDCLNQLTAQQALLGGMEFTVSMGQEVRQTEGLYQSYRWSRTVIMERLLEGTGRLIERTVPSTPPREEKLLEGYTKALARAAESSSIEEASRGVQLLREQAEQVQQLTGHELLHLVLDAANLFSLQMNIPHKEDRLEDFSDSCRQCSRVDQLFQNLEQFQREEMEAILSQSSALSTRPIRQAKQFVQSHFSENISLETVSAAIGFSSSYFSAIFKKEAGEGFAKYLTRVRIDRAKELLQQTNLPVADICNQVGYSDLKHFNSTFKKMTSLNPGQYRKLYG